MKRDEILKRVEEIFKEVLDLDHVTLSYETEGEDIEEWDSLTHVQLIVAIEKQFNIAFTSLEILGFKNVGDMCTTIECKLAAAKT